MEYRVTWLPFAALTCLVFMVLGGDSSRLAPAVPQGIPAEALCDSPECAYYAAVHFIELENTVVSTGEGTELWRALSLEGCYFCFDTLAVRAENEVQGTTFTGGELRVVAPDPSLLDGPEPGDVVVILDVDQGERIYHYGDGGVETVPEQILTLIMGMRWSGGYWQVLGVAVT